MYNKENGFSKIAVVVVVGIVIVAGLVLFNKKNNMPGYKMESAPVSQNTIIMGTSSELDTLSTDLDNANLDEMDNDLTQLNSDNSSF